MTKHIFVAAGLLFLIAGMTRPGGWSHPQGRIWLLIGMIFSLVSGWLFWVRKL